MNLYTMIPQSIALTITPQGHPLQRQEVKDFKGVCPHGVMVKAMDCGIVVSDFVLQLRYYIHFQANTHGEHINPLILQAMG